MSTRSICLIDVHETDKQLDSTNDKITWKTKGSGLCGSTVT